MGTLAVMLINAKSLQRLNTNTEGTAAGRVVFYSCVAAPPISMVQWNGLEHPCNMLVVICREGGDHSA